MKRRNLLLGGLLGTASVAAFGWNRNGMTTMPANAATNKGSSDAAFEVTKTVDEWKIQLTKQQFSVLREEATERPFSSQHNDEKRAGIFHCHGCDLPVYDIATKFDSGTGWPSFYQSLENAVRTKEDNTFFTKRTEVHCRRCGGHFGHIFADGPEPTGKRHCLNGVSLKFVTA